RAKRFEEVDTVVVFDDVLVPWENVLFYRHTRAASFIRGTLHRYSAFAFVQRIQKIADMLIGAALFNVRQTGLDQQQAVREKLAELACYRETINAHLTASIALAQKSPAGLLMPHQSLLYTGRVHACTRLPAMMHLARELCGGQICVTPDIAAFEHPETKALLEKYYSVNENWVAEDRRRLLAFARDLLNSDYAGHRVTFELFAQAPPFAHLNAVYGSFDWSEPLTFVKKSAGVSGRGMQKKEHERRRNDAARTPPRGHEAGRPHGQCGEDPRARRARRRHRERDVVGIGRPAGPADLRSSGQSRMPGDQAEWPILRQRAARRTGAALRPLCRTPEVGRWRQVRGHILAPPGHRRAGARR